MMDFLKNMFAKGYENIDATSVDQIRNDKNTMIVDVRESYEYNNGHIPKSKNIPVGQISNRLSEINKDKQIIVVCASGARSARAAGILARGGYNVKNMKGGMMTWRGKVK